ncbi:hypothetical protein CYLTODRAFT_424837 [Cylindrobasidium torrendii FP15055 ss-10]|uniref:Uncharacterized protein n=1 Tax=Cylindrobasidium torrendii FP15055 ss-10 TaxID=1314674 RepID=A0A0D7B5S0_9AGAR|nr:hypothetical protein CYLTODRAFT_424837 [Cylindrobasidium torrendii FP15055 ss-10]
MNIRDALFTTNQAPSAIELQSIDTILVQLHAGLDMGNSSTFVNGRTLDAETLIARLKTIRHPMRSLPDDVLGLIFAHCTPWCLADGIAEDSFPWYSSTDTSSPPWALSHVCRNWRAVVLSLPLLWATCRFILPRLDNPKYIERIGTIYQRSKSLPLRLYISTSFYSMFGHESLGILRTVLKTSYRWRCIRVDTHHDTDSLRIMFHNRPLPCLTHLSWDLGEPPPNTFVLAPRLSNLEFLCGSITDGINIQWGQITRYRSISSDLEYIGRMQGLEAIVIEEGAGPLHMDYVQVPDVQSTVLPKVRRIELKNTGGYQDIHPWLFSRYNFPALRTLILIESDCDYDRRSSSPFQSFMPSVNELSLSFGSANDIRSILPSVPNVQTLHIDGGDDPHTLVYSPIPGQPSAALNLHGLKSLSITLVSSLHMDTLMGWLDLPAWDKALTALRESGVRLETISFYGGFCGKVAPLPEDRWVMNIQKGMAESLSGWIQDGVQVLYHYDAEHRF